MLFESETAFEMEPIRHLVPWSGSSDTCLSTPCQGITDGKPTFSGWNWIFF